MIRKFPYLDEKTKEEVTNWLKSQEAEAKADAYRYEAYGNEQMKEKKLYTASTFGNIIIHLEYHMENE